MKSKLATILVLALSAQAQAVTSLGVREPAPPDVSSGQVPVVLATDAAAVAMQADVLFNPAVYTANDAVEGTQPGGVLVRSRVIEPGRLRVVVYHRSGGALDSDVVFQVPLTARNGVVSDDPVVLTDFLVVGQGGGVLTTSLQPKVRLVGLRDGKNLNGRQGIEFSVNASSVAGAITRVEYFIGGVLAGEGTGTGFRFLWTPDTSGPFEITAVAYESTGEQASTRTIPIVVTHVGTFDGPILGSYAGLVRGATFDVAKDGFVSMTSTTAGRFTLKMLAGGKALSGAGTFDADGNATVQISPGKGLLPWTVVLTQSSAEQVSQIHGRVADGTFAAGAFSGNTFETEFTVDRKHWDGKLRTAPQMGGYTVLLPASSNAETDEAPRGTGYGQVKVGKDGTAKFAGKLADGSAVTASSWISKNNQWPVYASLYKKQGVLIGMADFINLEGISDFDAALIWMRPADTKAPLFKDGFITETDAIGARYTKPATSTRLFPLANVGGNAVVYLTAGGLTSNMQRLASVSGANKVLVPLQDADLTAVNLNGATGVFSGSFIHPVTQKKVVFNGAALQAQSLLAGHFVASPAGGDVVMAANPELPPGEGDGNPLGTKPLPVVKITIPKAKSTIASNIAGVVQVRGTAADKDGIASVQVQVLHNDMLTAPELAIGTLAWTFDLPVAENDGGLYTVFAKAVDTHGDESEVVATQFWTPLKKDLLVEVDGPGTVSNGLLGSTPRDVGKFVTIIAKPDKTKKFLGWTGGITSSSPKINVLMKEGLTLQANFGD